MVDGSTCCDHPSLLQAFENYRLENLYNIWPLMVVHKGDKHFSLLCAFENYRLEKFYNI